MTDQPTTNDNADVTHSTAAPRLATRHEKPWLKTYRDHGMSADFTPPANDVTLMNVFENAFERFGNKQAYVCMGSGITFRQLDIYSRQVAAYLQGLGLKKARALL